MSDKPTANPCPFCGEVPATDLESEDCFIDINGEPSILHQCEYVDSGDWIFLKDWNTRAHGDELERVRGELQSVAKSLQALAKREESYVPRLEDAMMSYNANSAAWGHLVAAKQRAIESASLIHTMAAPVFATIATLPASDDGGTS